MRKSITRTREQGGFGMIELLIAMSVLAIGVLAVFSMFASGMVAIKRASTVTTAAALADTEMERFRAAKYSGIGLADADGNLVVDGADSTYTSDSAYRAVSNPPNALNSAVVLAATSYVPTRNVAGADGKSYRVDTFITWQEVKSASGTAGRKVKLVTIVVRDTGSSARVWARVASSFDESTGI